MALSDDLISQFVKITKDENNDKKDDLLYGTIVKDGPRDYVQLDGSDVLTPVTSTSSIKDGERVTVVIKNHTAIVTGNISSPSSSQSDLDDVVDQITDFEIVIADKVDTIEFNAEKARIDELVAENVTIKEKLTATEAEIGDLTADNVVINGKLEAAEGEIDDLKTTKLDAEIADIKYATIENLEATNIKVNNLEGNYGEFKELVTGKFEADEARIDDLETEKLDAEEAELKFANIDFANIGQAAIENFFSKSGMIGDLVVGDGTITGTLVGVTIKGDLIEGGTVVADKLVIKGTDGLFYKLNTDGETVGAEQTEYNSMNGSIITAKSVTAEKIAVNDLVAFDATIGGFNITENSLYSGVKSSIDNTTNGIYLDDEGQFGLGNSNNYLKYYKDQNGDWKLEISAQSISFSTSDKTIETVIDEIQDEIENVKDEVTTLVAIESSRGVMFKNSSISTTLVATVYRGSQRISDGAKLKEIMGETAHLQWGYKNINEEEYTIIESTDPRLSEDGFMLTLNPGEVDVLCTFMCELIT